MENNQEHEEKRRESSEDRPETPKDRPETPEDRPDEPGAEGGSKSPAADRLPALPADDDAPVGDTDQHSSG